MDLRESIKSQTDVALSMTKDVPQNEAKDKNLVFSPLSIHVVLSLIATGIKGPTLDQLLSFLTSKSNDQLGSFCSELASVVFADGSPTGGPCLSFANGVWLDKSLHVKPSFKQVVDNVYKIAFNQVDFQYEHVQVFKEINLWAEKETRGLIKEALPPGSVDAFTRLIFGNALYFKGVWDEAFDASKTKDYDFHLVNGSSVKVSFMTSIENQIIKAYDGFKVLGLPYKRGEDKRDFFMYFILPDAKDGLLALVEKVSSESGFLERHLPPYGAVRVRRFRIPRFKISFGFTASKLLKRLGLELLFSSEGGLSLTQIADWPQSVSEIFHKSFIEVNEEGTEAAAVTFSDDCGFSLDISDPTDFVADHPFLFLIRENVSGAVLFIGQVFNPLQKDQN